MIINAFEAKTQTDGFYIPDKVDEFIARITLAIDEAILEGSYSVSLGTDSTPDIVVNAAVEQLIEAGYKTLKKNKSLTILWEKAIEPEPEPETPVEPPVDPPTEPEVTP